MEPRQNIYYALGILAYSLAKVDGEIQDEEKEQLHEIVKNEMDHNIDFEYAEIIFQLLERDDPRKENVYNWAMSELNKGRHYLSPVIKEKMICTLNKIAQSVKGIDENELTFIERFKKDLANIGSEHYLK